MKEELLETINALAHSFRSESDAEHMEAIKNFIKRYHYLEIEKPEHFGLLTSLTLEAQASLLARIVLKDVSLESSKFHELEFLYTNHNFIEHHLDKIIVTFEGHGCSADKSRWLIDTYAHYIKTEELPVVNKKEYWHPVILDINLWMKWLSSFQKLYYGNEEEYVESKKVIVELYKEIIAKRTESLNEIFINDEYFTAVEEKDEKTEYIFYDTETFDKGTIIVDNIGSLSYRFFLKKENRFAKYGDTLPSWFAALLKN